MTFQQIRRERASSDKAQGLPSIPVPQRPSLPSRTNSAPVGALFQLDSSSKMTSMMPKDAGLKNLVRQQTLPEEEMLSTAGSPTAIPQRVSDEVWFTWMEGVLYGSLG